MPIQSCVHCRAFQRKCQCGRERSRCKVHGGWLNCQTCDSGQHHTRCTKCKVGSKLCPHNSRVAGCLICHMQRVEENGGELPAGHNPFKGEICCNTYRKFCKVHGGSCLCIKCGLTQTSRAYTECTVCKRAALGKRSWSAKSKETLVKSFLLQKIDAGELPAYTSHDKTPPTAKMLADLLCRDAFDPSRPDFLWVLSTHWVVVEVDENQHRDETYSCERRRELNLLNLAHGTPIVLIRYNPDSFRTASKSSARRSSATYTNTRLQTLLGAVQDAIQRGPAAAAALTVVHLFYDCDCHVTIDESSGARVHACGFTHTKAYADDRDFLLQHQGIIDAK